MSEQTRYPARSGAKHEVFATGHESYIASPYSGDKVSSANTDIGQIAEGATSEVIADGGSDGGAHSDDGSGQIDVVSGHDTKTADAGNGDGDVDGGDGDDQIRTGSGDDTIQGGAGDDTIFAGFGKDDVDGGDGDDQIRTGSGDDTIQGGAGNDTIFAGIGNDDIDGGDGNDQIRAGLGDDTIRGGAGNDTIFAGLGKDDIDGGDGEDQIRGGSGDDTIRGGAGDDAIFAGLGKDDVDGGEGDDQIRAGSGDDTIRGGVGNDTIFAGLGNDNADGGEGDDQIRGRSGDDTIRGGGGNDTIFAGLGDDLLVYDAQGSVGATDRYDGGLGYDTLRLDVTNDILNDQLFLAELAVYSSTAGSASQSGSGGTFSFDTLGLTLSGMEDIKLFVDDTEVDPADEPVVANDDAAVMVADQDTIFGNVLDNDSVLDGVLELTIGQATAHGAVMLDQDGVYMFMLDPADQTVSALAEGATLTDSFSYEVTDTDGDTDMATVSITITGTNDQPFVTSHPPSLISGERGEARLDLADVFGDPDSDDDGTTLTYELNSQPGAGAVRLEGRELVFDPSNQFEHLAQAQSAVEQVVVTATDQHGATVISAVNVTVTGENDAPTLSDGTLITNEDDGAVTLDLALLGDDIDNDDDGGSLTYDIDARPNLSGITTIDGTKLTFDLGSDFQGLAVGGSSDVDIGITATDQHGATVRGNVIAVVFGENDAPTLAAGVIAAEEDGPGVTLDLTTLGDDVDSDDEGGSLVYAIANDPAEGSAAIDSITGELSFDPGTDFQDLNDGDTRDVLIDITATDRHGEMATNTVTVTVAGADDNLRYGFVLNGIDANDKSGSSVSSAGDVNGDGIDDILIGANGASPNAPFAGETYLVFGRDTAIQGEFEASFDLSTLDGTNGFVLNGVNSSDSSGWSVSSAGDVNGDGIDDILIGAISSDSGGVIDVGATYVVFGRDTAAMGGFAASLSLSSLDGTNGFLLNGVDYNGRSGYSVSAAGDVNGDGIDDILIGAPDGPPQGTSAGKTYLVFGKDTATDGLFAASLDLRDLDGSNGFALNGVNREDKAGFSVSSAGDVNGDGVDDILIGARDADPNGQFSGETYVVFGKDAATDGPFATDFDLRTLDGTNGFVLNGVDQSDLSGGSVSSAGDVNGDGIDDILIGALGASQGGSSFVGEAYVVYGKDTATDGEFVASLDLRTLDGVNGFTLNGLDDFNQTGRSVSSAGDVNGDGIDDILIGAWRASDNGAPLAGETYIVFGRDALAEGDFSAIFELSTLDGTNGFVLNGSSGDYSGWSVSSAGDVDGDGNDDILIGAYFAETDQGNEVGKTYVVYGGNSSLNELDALDGADGQIELALLTAGDLDGLAI